MSLKDKIKPILQSIKSAKHQTLVSVHLHDNNFSIELKDYIMKKMGIKTANYHKLCHQENIADQDLVEQSILQRAFVKQEKIHSTAHQFFKQTRIRGGTLEMQKKKYESRLLNHQINSDTK